MSKYILAIVVLFIIFIPGESYSAWRVHDGSKFIRDIKDDAYEFTVNGMPCTVTKTEFSRGTGKSVREFRRLSCDTHPDTKVSVSTYCDSHGETDGSSLFILNKRTGKEYQISIHCNTIQY